MHEDWWEQKINFEKFSIFNGWDWFCIFNFVNWMNVRFRNIQKSFKANFFLYFWFDWLFWFLMVYIKSKLDVFIRFSFGIWMQFLQIIVTVRASWPQWGPRGLSLMIIKMNWWKNSKLKTERNHEHNNKSAMIFNQMQTQLLFTFFHDSNFLITNCQRCKFSNTKTNRKW